ncbi:MAG TPA: hypothetical protein EYQ24_10080 [Bacteroidetes bacterium]|nr:hypothetical protein [Bacteroidota bacterium]
MNIRPTSPYATPAAEVGGVRAEANATSGRTSSSPAPPAGADSEDRVELSAQGREAAQASALARASDPDLEAARVGLRAQPEISPARVQELREAIADGAYDTPEAIDAIAGALTRRL